MDDEMIPLDNVMSVQFAIEEEREYRAKIEAMNILPPQPLKPVVPLQGPPQSQVGLKRKEPATSSQIVTERRVSSTSEMLKNHPGLLLCHACKLAFSTTFQLRKHCASQRHNEKLVDFKKRKIGISNPLSCDLCKAQVSSVLTLEGHLNGQRHTETLKAFENAKLARAGQAWLQRKIQVQN